MVLAVFGVGEDFQDEDFSSIVVDGGDEAVMVSSDIENSDCPAAGYLCGIGMGECLTHFVKTLPCAFVRDFIPCRNGNDSVRV